MKRINQESVPVDAPGGAIAYRDAVKGKNGSITRNRKDLLFVVLMILFPTIQFLIFYIGTNANSLLLAFRTYDLGNFEGFSLINFKQVFSDITGSLEVQKAFKNTFVVYGVHLVISVPLSILFSYYIFKKFFGYKVFKVMLFLPNILSMLTLCFIFREYTDRALPELARNWFGIDMAGLFANGDTRYFALMFVYIFFSLGVTMLMYMGAMSGINDSVLEAAKLDGVNNFTELIYIVLPAIYPTIKTFLIAGIAGIFANQFNLFNFYGTAASYEYQTIGYYFYKLTATDAGAHYPYVAAFGLVISAVLIPVALLLNKLLDRLNPMAD